MNELEQKIFDELDLSLNLSKDEILELIDEKLQAESRRRVLPLNLREMTRRNIFNSIRELGILQELIEDQDITEIMVNGTEAIFIEKRGKLQEVEERFCSKEKLRQVIWQITSECNRVVNDSSPIVDARLKDGSRVSVVLDPIALNGPILTIRRFPSKPIELEDLYTYGSLTHEAGEYLIEEVRRGSNILVSGGTGSGKTTFLNVLSSFIPENQRVITIEDSAELQIKRIKNLVRLETRNANVEGCREITIRDLLKASLRMRPDRLIIGEVRSKETIDMLQSINVGHSAMTTVHANSVKDVVSRLETMFLMGMEMPIVAIRGQIASGFDLMVHLERTVEGKRRVQEIAAPCGMTGTEVRMKTIFGLKNERLVRYE